MNKRAAERQLIKWMRETRFTWGEMDLMIDLLYSFGTIVECVEELSKFDVLSHAGISKMVHYFINSNPKFKREKATIEDMENDDIINIDYQDHLIVETLKTSCAPITEVFFSEEALNVFQNTFPDSVFPREQDMALYLPFHLSIGKISNSIFTDERYEFLYKMRSLAYPSVEKDAFINQSKAEDDEALALLEESIKKGNCIRLWVDNEPDSLCGLYWLCSKLVHVENRILINRIPDAVWDNSNCLRANRTWGMMSSTESSFITHCFNTAVPLTQSEICNYAIGWKWLQQFGTMLRAFVNGKLVNVAEDFYDYLIFMNLGNEQHKVARLMGNIIGGVNNVGLGDLWFSYRIQTLINEGRISVVEDDPEIMKKVIAAADVD